MITAIYDGCLGERNNVNYDWLNRNGFFKYHPYKNILKHDDVIRILKQGGIDEDHIVINKP